MEMGLSEVFFPHGNFQDGFGFAVFIWVIGFTRGIASYNDFLVYIPVIEEIMNDTFFLDPVPIQNSSSCVITIPAMSENGTSGGLENLTLLNSELGQQDLSDILNGSRGGVIVERSSFGHIYLKQPTGDLTPLYDVTNGSRQYLVPVNIFNNTKICLYSGFDSVTYEIYVFNSTLVPEMLAFKVRKELRSFSTDCLLAGDMDSDVIFVNSSKQFGVMLIKPEMLPVPGSNRALESIPNTDYMRTEFIMVTDKESEIFVMGLENSDVRVETKEDEFNFTVMAHSVKKLNVKANLTLQLTSSKPIQVMCLTSMKTLQNMSFLNLFTVFPLERSFCNWFEISSSCVVEPCVIVVTKKMDNYPSVSINGSLVRATNYSFSDYHILEITSLQNGLHFLNVTNSAGLAVYVFDRDRARLYHVPPLNQNKCSEFVKSSSSSSVNKGDDKLNSTTYSSVTIPYLSDDDTSNISSSTEKLTSLSGNYSNSLNTTTLPLYNSTQKTPTEESAFQNVTTVSHQNTTNTATLRNVTESTPIKQAIEIEIGGVAAQSHSNQNASNSSHAANGKSPSYNIFFQDVEEDDYSQEYMMAVVLSLCVAIFAVIAVISSFLLMEFISRQKQIRNTKIRPFVS